MTKLARKLQDQRGITGLETAIVLIAFVVVASVFAFAVLSTGLLNSEKAETTVASGLAEAGVALAVKGPIIAYESTSTPDVVERIQVPIVTGTDESVDLSAASLVVTYIDADQATDLAQDNTDPSAEDGGNNPGWNTEFRAGDSGPALNIGERADFWVNLSGLATPLGASTEFTIQIKPAIGAVLEIQRTTPGEITTVVNLD